jgi:hypothetical protein
LAELLEGLLGVVVLLFDLVEFGECFFCRAAAALFVRA